MEWEILNANYHRWGQKTFSSKEAAEDYLKDFWRGVSGVRLDRFTIQEAKPGNRSTGHIDPTHPV